MQIDMDDLIQNAKGQGWRYDRATNGHHRFYSPDRKSIVTFASTPSDHRGWQNSLSDMKRAGYVPPNGNYTAPKLGDLMARGTQAEPKHETAGRGDVVRAVLACARNHAGAVIDTDTIFRTVKMSVPQTTRDSVLQTLGRIEGKDQGDGVLVRLERGTYRWRRNDLTPAPPPTTQAPPPPNTNSAPVAAAPIGDDSLAADIAALDTALAALGEIEGVVRRTKQKIDQLIALRKALGG